MKLKIDDLEKVVHWVKKNTSEVFVRLEIDHDKRTLVFKCNDKYQTGVEIRVFEEGSMGPRVRKEEPL